MEQTIFDFNHPHIDRSATPTDARLQAAPNLLLEDCFSVGFRVCTLIENIFVHTLIFADSFESLEYGISKEKSAIQSVQFDQPIIHVDVVYLRCMQTLDADFIAQDIQDEFKAYTKVALSRRNDDKFVVFGVFRNSQLILLDITSSDALMALSLARYKKLNSSMKDFSVLEVRQAHPAAIWFEMKFKEAAHRLNMINIQISSWPGKLH